MLKLGSDFGTRFERSDIRTPNGIPSIYTRDLCPTQVVSVVLILLGSLMAGVMSRTGDDNAKTSAATPGPNTASLISCSVEATDKLHCVDCTVQP